MRDRFKRAGTEKHPSATSSEGFSLIEVLVGVLIVGVVLAGVYSMYSTFVGMQQRVKERVVATAALVSVAEQLKALPWDELRTGFPNKACPAAEMVPSGVSLRCESTEVQPGLVQVRVQVFDRRGQLIDELQFLRFVEGF